MHKQMTIFDYEAEPQHGEIATYTTRGLANESVDRQARYKQIIEILKETDKPMSAKEIAVVMKEKGYAPTTERNFSAPRISEMIQNGTLDVATKKRCEYTGKLVTTYVLRES